MSLSSSSALALGVGSGAMCEGAAASSRRACHHTSREIPSRDSVLISLWSGHNHTCSTCSTISPDVRLRKFAFDMAPVAQKEHFMLQPTWLLTQSVPRFFSGMLTASTVPPEGRWVGWGEFVACGVRF